MACDEEEKTKTRENPTKQTNKERQKHRNRSRHAADKEEPTIQIVKLVMLAIQLYSSLI